MLRCMRTTLTLDPDVAALAERMRRVRAVDLGRCRLGSLDDVTHALAVAEGQETLGRSDTT